MHTVISLWNPDYLIPIYSMWGKEVNKLFFEWQLQLNNEFPHKVGLQTTACQASDNADMLMFPILYITTVDTV